MYKCRCEALYANAQNFKLPPPPCTPVRKIRRDSDEDTVEGTSPAMAPRVRFDAMALLPPTSPQRPPTAASFVQIPFGTVIWSLGEGVSTEWNH